MKRKKKKKELISFKLVSRDPQHVKEKKASKKQNQPETTEAKNTDNSRKLLGMTVFDAGSQYGATVSRVVIQVSEFSATSLHMQQRTQNMVQLSLYI